MPTIRNGSSQTVEGGLEMLAEIRAGLIGTASKLRLFQSTFNPTDQNVEADFEAAEANFTGYAAVSITWAAPGIDPTDGATMYGTRGLFVASDAVAPNTIGGCWISTQTAAGPPAVNKSGQYCVFNPPVPMTTALAQLFVTPVMLSDGSIGYFIQDN